MMAKRRKIDWLQFEHELREVLHTVNRSPDLDHTDALTCIDEIIARHTGRGNELLFNEQVYDRLSARFPAWFDWENLG